MYRFYKKTNYQNIEIIIHDDASSDNSIKKINKYKNIKIIKNKKRGNMALIIK
jgi:glycosyltransferase involved in cell wall biosynthesis